MVLQVMSRREQILIAVVVVLVVALVGTGLVLLNRGDDPGSDLIAASPSPSGLAPASPGTPSPSPESPQESQPAPQTPATCQGVGVPANATQVTQLDHTGDFDGDGYSDDLISYLDGGGSWHLHMRLAGGGRADLIVEPSGPAAVRALGGAAINEDAVDEAWAVVGAGASVILVQPFVLSGCDLTGVTAGAQPAVFPIGGSIGSLSGIECDDVPGAEGTDLAVFSGEHTVDTEYLVTANHYRLEGSVLTLALSDAGSADASTESGKYFSFNCGGLSL